MVRKHPIQNVEVDPRGVHRFVENKIVRHMLDKLTDEHNYNLNDIFVKFAESSPEDYEQLMQLIGYSLGGFSDLCGRADYSEVAPCKLRTLAAAERKQLITY